MSSYLSERQEFLKPTDSFNLNLINQVLQVKTQKFEANSLAAQQAVDDFAKIDVMSADGSRENYVKDRVQGLVDYINQSGNINFERGNIQAQIRQQSSQIIDDKILNDISNTAKFRQFNASVEEVKKKKPELYNNVNYNYAKETSGFNDWYEDGSKESYGSLQYDTFTDYRKELKDISENLEKYDDVIKQTTPDGKGYFITKEGTRLSEQDLKSKTYALLTTGARKQMQIDGWASYDQGSTEDEKFINVSSKFKQFRTADEKETEDQLSAYKLLKKNNPNDTRYADAVEQLEKNLQAKKNGYDSIQNNKSQMYTTMFTEDVVNGFAKTFAFDNVTESFSTDQAYWNQSDLDYKINKDRVEATTKAKTEFDGIQEKIVEQDPGETGSSYDNQEKLISSLDSTLQTETARVFNTLPVETQQDIDRQVEASKGKLTREGLLISLSKESSTLVSVADAKALDKIRVNLTTEKTAFNKYVKEEQDKVSKSIDTPNFISRVVQNPDIKIMWAGADGVERLYSASDVLKVNKIVDANGKVSNNLSSKPKLMEAFQKSILADKILSNLLQRTDVTKRLSILMGEAEDEVYTDVGSSSYTGISPTTGVSISQSGSNKVLNPNSKTARFLQAHQQQGGYNRAGIFSADDSFDDISEINQFMDTDVKAKVNERLSNDRTLSLNKTFMVDPKDRAFESIATLAGDVIDVNNTNSISITKVPNQPNMVRVAQLQKDGKVDTTKQAILRIEDLAPEVQQRINFQNVKQSITTENMPDIKQSVKFGDINDINRRLDLQENILGNDQRLAYLTTKKGTVDSIFNNPILSSVVGQQEAPTEVGNVILQAINDPNIQVGLVKNGKYVLTQISRKMGEKEEILFTDPTPVSDSNIESVRDKITFTPQIYLATLLQNIVLEKKQTGNSNEALLKLTQIYGQ